MPCQRCGRSPSTVHCPPRRAAPDTRGGRALTSDGRSERPTTSRGWSWRYRPTKPAAFPRPSGKSAEIDLRRIIVVSIVPAATTTARARNHVGLTGHSVDVFDLVDTMFRRRPVQTCDVGTLPEFEASFLLQWANDTLITRELGASPRHHPRSALGEGNHAETRAVGGPSLDHRLPVRGRSCR